MAIKNILVKTTYLDTDSQKVYALPKAIITWQLVGSLEVSSERTNYLGECAFELDVVDAQYLFTALYPEGYELPITTVVNLGQSSDNPVVVELRFPTNPEQKPSSSSRNIRVQVTYVDLNGDNTVKPLQLATIKYCYPKENTDNFIAIGETNSEGILTYGFPSTEEGIYKIIAEHPGFADAVAKDINLYASDLNPIIIDLQWPNNPTIIPDPHLGEVLPYEMPSWIYEGDNPDEYEYGTGIVLNRAPKEIQTNVESLLKFTKARVKYTDLFDNRIFSIDEYYNYREIVLDDYGLAYVCVNEEGSQGNPLTDTNYWKQVKIAGTGAVLDVNGGFI